MVIHTPGYCKHIEIDHIELHAEDRQKLPVTETGYRSHFIHESHIEPYGSALAFVQAWLDHEGQSREWQAHVAATQQLSLF